MACPRVRPILTTSGEIVRVSLIAVAVVATSLGACAEKPAMLGGIATSSYTTACVNAYDPVEAITVDTKECTSSSAAGCHLSSVEFKDGPLAGRTLSFDDPTAVGGLEAGETAFLEDLSRGTMSGAYLVGVQTASSSNVYAVYNSEIASDTTKTTGNLSYVGTMVAHGHSPTGSGLADGVFSAFVSFDAAKVIGQMNSIEFRDGGTFPVIRFTADIEGTTGTFYADTLQIDGAPTFGHLEGVIGFPTGSMAGAFGVNSGNGPTSTSYGLTGVYDADEEEPASR